MPPHTFVWAQKKKTSLRVWRAAAVNTSAAGASRWARDLRRGTRRRHMQHESFTAIHNTMPTEHVPMALPWLCIETTFNLRSCYLFGLHHRHCCSGACVIGVRLRRARERMLRTPHTRARQGVGGSSTGTCNGGVELCLVDTWRRWHRRWCNMVCPRWRWHRRRCSSCRCGVLLVLVPCCSGRHGGGACFGGSEGSVLGENGRFSCVICRGRLPGSASLARKSRSCDIICARREHVR